MQEVMTRIELGGVLGKTFGKIHHRLISRVSEAGVALAKTIPGFEQFMISSQRRGLTYSVFKGKNIGVDDLGFPVTGDVIRIVPVIIGSKSRFDSNYPGRSISDCIDLDARSEYRCQQYDVCCWCVHDAGGVVQMLSPQATGLASKQSSDNRASYAFGGVTNTSAQGYPVPLYGRRRIGGAIISAGIYVEDQQ